MRLKSYGFVWNAKGVCYNSEYVNIGCFGSSGRCSAYLHGQRTKVEHICVKQKTVKYEDNHI